MGDVVNLRLARKRKARARNERTAAENRAVHGRTKAEKLAERTQARRAENALDGHRIERPGRDDGDA